MKNVHSMIRSVVERQENSAMVGELCSISQAITNQMTIRYYRKDNYGNCQFYAVDHADEITGLTGRLTLSRKDMEILRALGFELKEVLRSEAVAK